MIIERRILELDVNNNELNVGGTPLFPCGAYHSDLAKIGNGFLPWHWHKQAELFYVVDGGGSIEINGASFPLRKGQGGYINSNVLHSASVLCGSYCIYNALVFDPNFIAGGMSANIGVRLVRPLMKCGNLPWISFDMTEPWHARALECFAKAHRAMGEEAFGYELEVWEGLTELWRLIIQNKADILENGDMQESVRSQRVKSILQYMKEHLPEKINLRQVAAANNISERECLRCFEMTIGIPPMQYLQRLRITEAAHMLLLSDLSVTEICDAVGFDDASYFSKMFRRHMGYSPTDYRKNFCQVGYVQ